MEDRGQIDSRDRGRASSAQPRIVAPRMFMEAEEVVARSRRRAGRQRLRARMSTLACGGRLVAFAAARRVGRPPRAGSTRPRLVRRYSISMPLASASREQPLDQPGTGSVHAWSTSERSTTRRLTPLSRSESPASARRSSADRHGRPDAGQAAGQHAAILADLDMRVGAWRLGGAGRLRPARRSSTWRTSYPVAVRLSLCGAGWRPAKRSR